MKRSMMACAVAVAVAGCTTGSSNMFAAREKTVEYYRVFDIKTDPSNPAVVKAATEGLNRNVADATMTTPAPLGAVQEKPGQFKMAEPSPGAPGQPAPRSPSCEGATWTARAVPRVTGGENMNMIACLFPYKNGYHLDMYATFTRKEGGLLEWPRRLTGRVMGTPEKWTDKAMLDVVQAIRDSTGAQVALVEAKPQLEGAPWLGPGVGPGAAPGATPSPAPGAAPVAAPAGAAPAGAAGGTTGSSAAGATTAPVPAAGAATAPVPAAGAATAPVPAAGAATAPVPAAGAATAPVPAAGAATAPAPAAGAPAAPAAGTAGGTTAGAGQTTAGTDGAPSVK